MTPKPPRETTVTVLVEVAVLLAVSLGLPGMAAAETPPMVDTAIQARRISKAPLIDGEVDDPAWARAVPFTRFVDSFPTEGAVPADRTEVRVLYDNENIYIGFICHDTQPDQIVRMLGDRDAPPVSDTVEVSIDVAHDRRTAYLFGVNAAGVQYDRLHFADNQSTAEWDAVWEARVAARPDGWSAELAIPLRIFRFPAASSTRASAPWGFLAKRHLARTHEDMATTLMPRSSKGYVSLFGDLAGLDDLHPRLNVEVLPYLAARTVSHPQFSDSSLPGPRLNDPSMDVGMDVRASFSRLQLNATINPDFGQVEADQVVLNLTNQEAAFPEKRPFFFQGTEIFQPVSAGSGVDGGQVLFYSRRIGLTNPILGAAKLTGELGPRLSIGLLDAFVAGVKSDTADETAPDRRLRFHSMRPLHVGPNNEATASDAAAENYFAGVLTYRFGEASTVGLRTASAVPLPGPCPADGAGTDPEGKPLPLPPACQVAGNNAGAVDWALRTADEEWAIQGQAEVSSVVGGPRTRVLPDGVVLGRGQTGWGTYVQAGKLGGEPIRFDLNYSRISPTLDLNGAGFLPTQNQQDLVGELHFIRPSGFWGLHAFDSALNARTTSSTDGRRITRNRNVTLALNATLPGFHKLGVDLGYEGSYYDIREITGRGIGVPHIPLAYVSVQGETDPSRMLSVKASVARDWVQASPVTPARNGWTTQLNVLLKLQSRFESNLNVTVNNEPLGPRWTDQVVGDRIILGDLHSGYLSATFRQQMVILPRLVVQAYAQLFTAYGRYSSVFAVSRRENDNSSIQFDELAPSAASVNGFYRASLRVNLVARWEYRPGSTFFAVYNHTGEGVLSPDQQAPATLAPAGLRQGRNIDTFLVKWSYFWHI
jgi:hypothetical protein